MKLPNEAEFTAQVIQYARLHGWRVAHFRPALTAKGWRTPVQGDGKGFPDLVLVRGGEIVFAELKCGKNKPSAEQREWLDELARNAGVRVREWKPEDWPEIERILGGRS